MYQPTDLAQEIVQPTNKRTKMTKEINQPPTLPKEMFQPINKTPELTNLPKEI